MVDENPEDDQMVRVTLDPRDFHFHCYECDQTLSTTESKEIWDTVTDYVGEEYGSNFVARVVNTAEEFSDFDPTGTSDLVTGIPTVIVRNVNAMFGISLETLHTNDVIDIEGVKKEHPALDYYESENKKGVIVRCEEHR